MLHIQSKYQNIDKGDGTSLPLQFSTLETNDMQELENKVELQTTPR